MTSSVLDDVRGCIGLRGCGRRGTHVRRAILCDAANLASEMTLLLGICLGGVGSTEIFLSKQAEMLQDVRRLVRWAEVAA